jgi:murein L,D-transpeptidase YcbB/YkuD
VQKFQTRHGLTADGLIGIKTLRKLNVPIDERIQQLAASLEHCQSLPPIPDRDYIVVNIADFTLKLFDDGKLLLFMLVIVGKTYRQTPTFNGHISSLVLNPSWTIAHSIATEDILPKIKNNPRYLKQLQIRVLRDAKVNREIDPDTVNWAHLSTERFPYRLRQDPGPANALGRMKFLFPNPYDVYLHDTPAQELFQKDARTFSSGCIRLAKPLELAVYLLQGTPLGSIEALTAAISSKKTQSLAIPSPIAIYIVYVTAWVDPEGIIQFRPNIYNRDPAL